MNTEFLAMKEKIDQQQSVLQKTIDIQSAQIATLQARLEHQTNRNSRKSVIESELFISNMRKHGRNSRVYVEQRYGPDTTWRRNNALALRKDLKAQGAVTSGFIAYPAKLMVKYNAQDRQYTMHQDFSNTEVPVQTRTDNNSAA